MFNEFLLQFKENIEISCLQRLINIRVPQKILIMYHYLICCKLKSNLHINNN
jgi:hypothetical protein